MKLSLFLIFLRFFTSADPPYIPGFWGLTTNDTRSYLDPIEEALATAEPARIFGYRMFGYGLPYLVFRSVLPPAAALNALIVAQLVLAALSVLVVGLLAVRLSGRREAFVFAFGGYFLLPIVSFYDIVALTESFTTTALTLSVYLLLTERRLLSGCFLAWCVFMRPVAFPLAGAFLAYTLWQKRGDSRNSILRSLAALMAPLLIAECVWAAGRIANGATEDVLLPASLHSTYRDESKHTLAMIGFLKALGEPWTYSQLPVYRGDAAPTCPIETSRFDCASVGRLLDLARQAQTDILTLNPAISPAEALAINRQINAQLPELTAAIRQEHPLRYHLVAPFRYLLRVVTSSSTGRMFGSYATMRERWRPLRLLIDCFWWGLQAALAAGLVTRGALLSKNAELGVVFFVIAYFYLVHAWLFRMDAFRYLLPVLPLMVVLLTTLWLARPAQPRETPEPSATTM